MGKRSSRRAWPIHAYVGANGGGKSLCAVWDTLPSLAAGRQVLSTVRILDYRNPRVCEGCDEPDCEESGHLQAHPGWVKFTEWPQLLSAEHCDVLMDEVTGVASSRESQSMPAAVANGLVQLRRQDVVLRWTTPSWARADKVIRECTQAVTFCRGMMPAKATDATADRVWRQRRLFKWQTYDAFDFEDFTAGKRASMAPQISDFHWGPGSPAFDAYSTYDAVSVIGTVSDSGRCAQCGGRRQALACSCVEYVSRKPVRARKTRSVEDAEGPSLHVTDPVEDVA